MSRTLKDRPHWVKQNDKNLPRIAEHEHKDAGKPIVRYVPVKDENGNPVMETYTTYGFLGYRSYNVFERRYNLFATWEELEATFPTNYIPYEKRFYAQYGDVEKTRVKHEYVVVGHRPTECTIGDYQPRGGRYFFDSDATHLCYYTLKYYAGHYRNCDHFPSVEERKDYHRKSRSNENAALHKLKKAANAGYDYEDDIYEDVFNERKQRHRGWWC